MRAVSVVLAALVALSGWACGSTQGGVKKGGPREGIAAPEWAKKPPQSPSKLYFVGDTSGAFDEPTARDLAVQKAIAELTVYCGASVKSEASSVEVEQNGKQGQSYSVTVDVAGDEITLREALVKEVVVGRASDGTFDAYALLEWPKAQYEAVLVAQRERARRALELYLEGEAAAGANDVPEAKTKVREVKAILGPMRSRIPVQHAKIADTGLLADAVKALEQRIEDFVARRRKLVAVAVECDENGAAAGCPSHRVGAVGQRVSGRGFTVATAGVPSRLAREILASANPSADAQLRSAGFVVAVRYDANLLAKEDGFTFVHCGARGVVYDTDAHRIVSVKEVKPIKGGHVHFQGAAEKGCGKAEEEVVGWLDQTLSGMK